MHAAPSNASENNFSNMESGKVITPSRRGSRRVGVYVPPPPAPFLKLRNSLYFILILYTRTSFQVLRLNDQIRTITILSRRVEISEFKD